MSAPTSAVVIMAKAPCAGRVKTRLEPLLGPVGAARLQALLIRHAAWLAAGVSPTFVAVDPPDALRAVRALVPASVELFSQTGGDLGSRMQAAVDCVADRTDRPVIVIGTDAPTLTRPMLVQADRCLTAGAADLVIGPALDGGYYLIGLTAPTRPAFAIDPATWGGDRVLAATLAALGGSGKRIRLLRPLRDLDTPADAAALAADSAVPRSIACLLAPVGVTA